MAAGSNKRGGAASAPMPGKDYREKHHGDDGCDKHWIAYEMIPEGAFKPGQGISLRGVHKEHEVGIQQKIHRVDQHCQNGQKPKTIGHLPQPGPDVASGREHDWIHRQKDVDGKAVQVHEIGRGKRRPGGEEQGGRRGGDAHSIEEAAQQPGRAGGMDDDQNNIDAAKVQGKISKEIIARCQQADSFKGLVGKEQHGKYQPHPSPLFPGKPSIEQGAENGGSKEQGEPSQMDGAEEGEAQPRRNSLDSGEEILLGRHLL